MASSWDMRVRKCCAVVFIRLLVLLTYNQLMHVGLSQKCILKISSLSSPYVTFTIYLFVEKPLKWSCILLLMNQHLEFPIHWFKSLNIQHSEHWNICEFWVCVDMKCIMISWYYWNENIFYSFDSNQMFEVLHQNFQSACLMEFFQMKKH